MKKPVRLSQVDYCAIRNVISSYIDVIDSRISDYEERNETFFSKIDEQYKRELLDLLDKVKTHI